MSYTKIAPYAPFEGAPKINLPSIVGASPKKPILIRIPVTGARPVTYAVEALPEGLTLENNIISGSLPEEGNYIVTVIAENALGRDEKKVLLEIKDGNILVTPLMGFTSWNAFGANVTQENMIAIADRMVELGLTEYGYTYVNTDSSWQDTYGGEHDAIMPNHKFPDMKAMTDYIHSLGLKCGIYSSPFLHAWGEPPFLPFIPGCTVGERDYRFSGMNTGIGVIHKEANCVKQWDEWGFDYLKYDWSPADPVNAEIMRQELLKASRDFGYCITVNALPEYWEYWSNYVNSYRCGTDSLGTWDNLMQIFDSYFKFDHCRNKGHYQDLDMLDVGNFNTHFVRKDLTEDEAIVAYTVRAFFNSPIQISSTLEEKGNFDFELALYGNEEIIALNQDCHFSGAHPIFGIGNRFHIFEMISEEGGYAYAVFNLTEEEQNPSMTFEECAKLRDVWAKEDMPSAETLTLSMKPHTVRVFRSSQKITTTEL